MRFTDHIYEKKGLPEGLQYSDVLPLSTLKAKNLLSDGFTDHILSIKLHPLKFIESITTKSVFDQHLEEKSFED